MVTVQRLQALHQPARRPPPREALPGVVVAEDHRFRLVDRRDLARQLDVLVAEVADEQHEILIARLDEVSIRSTPMSVQISHDKEGGGGGHGLDNTRSTVLYRGSELPWVERQARISRGKRVASSWP